jgi:signal transduction histidine kinase
LVRPSASGQLGELFWSTQDAVVVVAGDRVVAWNPAAERIFGVPADVALAPGFDLAALLGLSRSRLAALPDAPTGTIEPPGCGPLQITAWRAIDSAETVLLFADVSPSHRIERGLRELNGFAGRLLRQRPSLDDLLGQLSACARTIAGSGFAAAVLVLPGTLTVTHVTVDAEPGDPPESSSVIAASLHDSLVAGASMHVDSGRLPASVGDEDELSVVGPFLAVPIRSGGQTIGLLVVGNKPGGRAFDGTDDSLLTDLAQHAASAIASVADETRRRQSEDRRRDAIAAARHDIANPLAAGRGYVQILQRRYDDMTPEQRVRALRALAAAFARLEEYSHRLLLDERLEVSAPPLRWTDIDIDRFLDEFAADAAAMHGPTAVRVTVQRREGCPRTLAADPELLREVIDNLLSNAVKFSPKDGDIRVVARRDRRQVRLEVVDAGVGIPLEEQASVFERHTRTRQSRRDAVPGMGLGLSIVRRIVEAHGGQVGLRSRPGVGTAVWVTFPMECPPFVVESQGVGATQDGSA